MIRKFRGKQKSWIYGGISIFNGEASILDYDCVANSSYEVDIKSVGQFINKYYKDGREMYENDIVSGGCYNGSYALGVIKYVGNAFVAVPIGRFIEGCSEDFERFEYLGNTFDDSHYLEEYY